MKIGAATMVECHKHPNTSTWFLFGGGICIYACWSAGTLAGCTRWCCHCPSGKIRARLCVLRCVHGTCRQLMARQARRMPLACCWNTCIYFRSSSSREMVHSHRRCRRGHHSHVHTRHDREPRNNNARRVFPCFN